MSDTGDNPATDATTPQHFICPITMEIMKDPVVDTEGVSYEREAITTWLNNGNANAPTTNKPLSIADLRPNRALREAIEQHLGIESSTVSVGNVGGAEDTAESVGEQSPVAEIQASSSNPEVDLDLNIKYDGEYMMVSIEPPEGSHTVRSSICCVVDVSGSMGSEATVQDENGKTEAFGLSVLDVTKHALKTIVKSLTPQDELSLVTFSSEVEVVMQPVLMTESAANTALQKIDSLHPQQMTNLWGGLQKGLDLLIEKKARTDNVAIFLLTDGLPNVSPGKGEAKALEGFKNNNKGLPCRIHTFGFGYQMDSLMLSKLSSIGGGCYSFIPDSSFVGTVFVNAVANHITTAAHTLQLNINGKNVVISSDDFEAYDPTSSDDKHMSIQFGSVQYGQPKNIVFPIKKKQSKNCYLEVSLKYFSGLSKKQVEKTYNWDLALAENDNDIKYHRLRLALVKGVKDMLDKSDLDFQHGECRAKHLKKSQDYEKDLVKKMKKLVNEKEDRSKDLMKDFTGQISEAFSKKEYFFKWGVHFCLSISVAHLYQFCNNFKDPGIQHYSSELFSETRDKLDNIFVSLPAPKPSIPPQQSNFGGNSGITRSSGPINMRAFYNMRGGCFHGSSLVHLAGQQFCRADCLKKGDKVLTGEGTLDEVECVVKTICTDKSSPTELVKVNESLITTPWHPIKDDDENTWKFPIEAANTEQLFVHTDAVYTFLLKSRRTILIGNVECATLAHGLQGDVIGHKFLGEESVARDLKRLDDFETGLITLEPENFKRDLLSGEIVAIA